MPTKMRSCTETHPNNQGWAERHNVPTLPRRWEFAIHNGQIGYAERRCLASVPLVHGDAAHAARWMSQSQLQSPPHQHQVRGGGDTEDRFDDSTIRPSRPSPVGWPVRHRAKVRLAANSCWTDCLTDRQTPTVVRRSDTPPCQTYILKQHSISGKGKTSSCVSYIQ